MRFARKFHLAIQIKNCYHILFQMHMDCHRMVMNNELERKW